ncbi:hypothetical protein [Alteromonas oceanisediminis]|uniref:hypothetical protein n=1 Tax=Alteromonas oceanisediminis TaxID=2836180 RepID=UPI001BD99CC1|nr:hypothetical protein [Alteromonas oceanisediminis]MBT0586701.1 hypothetical protein [Alteromonas oceanisediminis]
MTDEQVAELKKMIHDARKPLNRISMQSEIVKMALNGELPAEKAIDALAKILQGAQDCSQVLADFDKHLMSLR